MVNGLLYMGAELDLIGDEYCLDYDELIPGEYPLEPEYDDDDED